MEAGGEGVVVGEGTGSKSTEMGVAAEAEGKIAAEEEVEVEKEDNLGKVKGLDSRLFVILAGNLNFTLLNETHMRASILNTIGSIGSVFQAMRTFSGGLAAWLNLRAEIHNNFS